MKNKIKYLILFGTLFFSCSFDKEPSLSNKYPYDPDQPLNFNIRVVPMEGVNVDLSSVDLEINADYFNRYGIGVFSSLEDGRDLPQEVRDGELFIPEKEFDGFISVYVVPKNFINMRAAGYAVRSTKSIVIREDYILKRTLAHEIGHIFTLDHINEENNVMRVGYISGQYDEPNIFNESQVKKIKKAIDRFFN